MLDSGQHRRFPVKLAEFLKTFFYRISPVAVSKYIIARAKIVKYSKIRYSLKRGMA